MGLDAAEAKGTLLQVPVSNRVIRWLDKLHQWPCANFFPSLHQCLKEITATRPETPSVVKSSGPWSPTACGELACRIHISANVMVNRDFRSVKSGSIIGNCDTSRMKLQTDRRRLRCNVLNQRPLSMIMLDEVNIIGSRRETPTARIKFTGHPRPMPTLFSHIHSALCSHLQCAPSRKSVHRRRSFARY